MYNGEELIYEASPDELDGLAANVPLGTFRKGEATALTVELTVPIELGNEYASRVGEVDWIFTVEALFDPEPTPTPTPTPEPTDEPDSEENPPQEESPAPTPGMGGGAGVTTGDNLHLGLYIVLMLASVVVLLVVRNRMKKRDKE